MRKDGIVCATTVIVAILNIVPATAYLAPVSIPGLKGTLGRNCVNLKMTQDDHPKLWLPTEPVCNE